MANYNITDDSGFLAIVNPEKYHSFMHEDWQFSDLLKRFQMEMSKNHLIIWSTGREETWNIQLINTPSNQTAFRQFEKTIEVSNRQLLLTNFEDMTMSAQFADIGIVSQKNQAQLITIENGLYKAIIRQMHDPEEITNTSTENTTDFEIIFSPISTENHRAEQIENIFWWTAD